jgi:hypothetical protein
VLKVTKVFREHRDSRVLKVLLVPKVLTEHKVLKVL